MKSWARCREWVRPTWLLSLLGAACSMHGAPISTPNSATPSHPRGAGATTDAAELPNQAVPSCKDLGVLGCDVPPSPLAELCSRSSQCLIGSDDPKQGTPARDFKCDPPRDSLPAPTSTALKATAVVRIEAAVDPESEDSRWREEASYLVAETSLGFCLVDQLLSWEFEKDYMVETKFQFTWSKQNGIAPELHAESQFVAKAEEEVGDREATAEDVVGAQVLRPA